MSIPGLTALILAVLCAASLIAAYICFRIAFYAPPRKRKDPEEMALPEGKEYEPHYPYMRRWIGKAHSLPREDVTIRSYDGLTLRGKFYEYAPGAPIELMFHGYRGDAVRDLSCGIDRCFRLGRSILLVDQRCCGDSDGKVITFGIREHRDCLDWLDYLVGRFPDRKIILTGVSMGAATVLLCADKPLPPNVMGILADCGFSSARDIMQEVIRQMGLPPKISYPFVKLGARIFGGFDPDADSPVEAVKRASVPVIFFHGEADTFVPTHLSQTLYDACTSRKKLVTIPGAAHGLSFPVAPERYLKELKDFFGPEASHPSTQ